MVTAYIGLGSNLGDRASFLERAVGLLRQLPQTSLQRVSQWHETEPQGGPPQGFYLNGAAEMDTRLSPHDLLWEIQRIETLLGRPAIHERWGPRIIDLDILSYGALILSTPQLTLPHLEMEKRSFVLLPLAEIAPSWTHPGSGKTVRQLLVELARADRSSLCGS